MKNLIVSTKQSNKRFVLNDIVSKDFRIEIQVFQQQQKLNDEKKEYTLLKQIIKKWKTKISSSQKNKNKIWIG